MSTNTKRLLIILVVAVVVCIVGAAAAIGGVGLLADRFKDNITMDSKKVRTMANEFVTYELPDGYQEQMGMDFLVYKMVILGTDFKSLSSSSSSGPSIILTHFQATQGMTPEQMTEQMQKSFEQQSSQKGLKFKHIETRTVTIKGEETTLNVNEGTDSSGNSIMQWITNFPGKTGIVILMIQGSSDGWDDAALNDFLASIQ